MECYKTIVNLYKLILINISLIVCLSVWFILYKYIFVNIDISGINVKGHVVEIFRFLESTGLASILFGAILYRLFSMVYDISEWNLIECLRQKLLSDYKISSREASLQINNGLSVYAESLEQGIFFKISYRDGKAIIDRLASGDKTELKCSEISTHDLETMTNESGVSFYKSEAYDKMIDSGFTITE